MEPGKPQTNSLPLREHLLDSAEGLAGALFVFYQAESYVGVAVVAEAYSWGDGGLRISQDQLGELQGAEVAVLFGDLGPDEHGGLGQGYGPA